MERAVFLDRDGVLNRLVLNPKTGDFESPHHPRDMELYPWTLPSLKTLRAMGYLLFLVSNQPSYAKGKTTIENIHAIHGLLHRRLAENGIDFAEYYYCYHHPEGVIPGLTCVCECRKPGIFFLREADRKYRLNTVDSWFIGDRDSDILCGKNFGVRTILINGNKRSGAHRQTLPDFKTGNLKQAVKIIALNEQKRRRE